MLELFIVTLLFCATPGPGTLGTLAMSTRYGFKAGLLTGVGILLGDLVYLNIVIFSLGMLADTLADVMIYVKYIGAAYLVYLGVKQFLNSGDLKSDIHVTPTPKKQVLTGFLITGTNPKVIVFYLSLLPLFIDLNSLSLWTGLQVAMTISASVILVLVAVSLAGQKLKSMISKPHIASRMKKITGAIMVGVGVAVART